MSNNNFLANESASVAATKLSAWDNLGTSGEKIPANVPTNPDGTAQAQALTNAQLRSADVDVSINSAQLASLQPIAGGSTEATLALIKGKTDNIDVALSTRTKPSDEQNIRPLTASDTVTAVGTFFPAIQATSNALDTSSNGTITSVLNSITSVLILAANPNRKGFIIHNDSITNVFVAFAVVSSTTGFTLRLTSQSSYFSNTLPIYRGAISAIATSVNGNLRITELT